MLKRYKVSINICFLNGQLTKKILFSLFHILCIISIAPVIYACDPMGCLFIGHKQDSLILGEVVSATKETYIVKVLFIFPQNKVKSFKIDDQITVKNFEYKVHSTSLEMPPPTISIDRIHAKSKKIVMGEKKYLMSLDKIGNYYFPLWGTYEITGNTYSDAKLKEMNTIEDKALQIYINSGGRETDFAFDYSGDEPVLTHQRGKK